MTVGADTESSLVWKPDRIAARKSRMQQFLLDLREQGVFGAEVATSHDLQRWSVENPEEFWAGIWRAAEIMALGPGSREAPWHAVLSGGNRMAPPDSTLGPRWFPGVRLNFAEHLLRRRDDAVALVSWNELGPGRRITYRELRQSVARCAAALSALGVGVGDRVVGWLPNLPETVVAMLATTSLGAIWSSCSPDFGTRGVLDRFGQISPTVLIAADGYRYAGREIDCLSRLREIVDAIPTLAAVWVVPCLHDEPDISTMPEARLFDAVLSEHSDASEPGFVRLQFDHPIYIMYSSGTTGLPKCMVHGAGGTLLQHWKELALHTDVGPEDVLFYFTTCGWMMWNWLVSGLALGATLVLYDGAPLAPDPAILWRMAAAEGITIFGTSARYLAALEHEKIKPRELASLTSLRAILSTGSPLAAHSYDFVLRDISPSVRLSSISGGTDIISCFALGDPTGPVYRGELQMRGLGMAVEVWDENGNPVVGKPGELVCTRPFPSMPIAFWNDPDRSLYRAAYFSHFPGVWRHGDWAEITSHDGLVIHGRSDATLNPGGVRIGTAELYRVVEKIPEIADSVVVEQRLGAADGTGSRVVLFVRLGAGQDMSDELSDRIRQRIRRETSPHHVPRLVLAVPDIPRTISGKTSEIAVRNTINGEPVRNLDALANPESLEWFRNRPELHDDQRA